MQRSAALACLLFVSISPLGATEPQQQWASVDRVNRRTCPSTECGVIGQLFFRESAKVYEVKDGWARISDYYDASCVGGVSEYVDRGNKGCTEQNGIVEGRFAEWVSAKLLSNVRPPDPAAGAEGDYKLVAQSDDYAKYKDVFATTAKKLIDEGTCKASEFIENGGWMKSTTTYQNQPVYFTYCGGMTVSNRLYLDASTGRVFK